MISPTASSDRVPAWQRELANAISSVQELLEILELDALDAPISSAAMQQFPLRVTRSYVERMGKRDPDDPLLLQVLPAIAEAIEMPGFSADPLQESASMPAPGVIRKYRGRVLLTVTGACGIHCRYCFRRHFPYSDANPARDNWQTAADYIRDNPDLGEVILSGGDPLVMNDTRLARLCATLEKIPHVSRLRIHTRLPVVLPERVDEHLTGWLTNTRLHRVLVLHVNHPNEVSEAFAAACRRLRDCGATLLNQSVLLKGINDSASTLAKLSEALFAAGVLPYYIHQLDRVQGSAHFETSLDDAQAIMTDLHAAVPGYLVPRFVREIPGAAGKLGVWQPRELVSPGVAPDAGPALAISTNTNI